ncbi:MAG TPA: hypothetical protein VIE41_17535, partial [Methylomirabilota bacterium]
MPARQAFGREDPAALQSQAATLLLLRAQLRGDAAALAARAGRVSRRPRTEMVPPRDVAALRVPRLRGTRRRIPEAAVRAALATRYGPAAVAGPSAPQPEVAPDVLSDIARRCLRSPTVNAAAQLTRACLGHRHELPRVAAAATYFELSSSVEPALTILGRAVASPDPLVQAVAATALAQIAPDDARLRALLGSQPRPSASEPSHTSL